MTAAAILVMGAASTGNFRRFERFSLILVLGSLLLVPIFAMAHPPAHQLVHDFFVPAMPKNAPSADVMLLIIAIVGTTVAPWQLFFQQSYVVDKRITPRFIRYERIDLWLGIAFVIIGAMAMMAFTSAAFHGKPEFGHFADAGAVSAGLEKYVGHTAGVMFALALIDACIIGASAVSLATAYAIGDVLSLKHSLHRKPTEAVGFYAVYFGLIVVSAALVLTPNIPLGLLTNAVQTLAGVLLPGATVFLMLLCNDKAVLGPWTNTKVLNFFTGAIIAVLVMLSVILTASVLFPNITGTQIEAVLAGGSLLTILVAIIVALSNRGAGERATNALSRAERDAWQMPPLDQLPPGRLTPINRIWMTVLRGYLIVAGGLVLVRIVELVTAGR